MATIVLQTVGAAVGGMIGGPIGAMAGRALGGLAGAAIDNALLGGDNTKYVEGPRLKDIDGLTSTEGAPIPRVYGRARVGGQLIWATRFEEVANATAERSGTRGGGKSLGGGRRVIRNERYDHLFVLRQSGGGIVRRPDRLRAPGVGGRARTRPHHADDAGASRRREPAARSADRRQGRRGERARLPRPRLRGVRAF